MFLLLDIKEVNIYIVSGQNQLLMSYLVYLKLLCNSIV